MVADMVADIKLDKVSDKVAVNKKKSISTLTWKSNLVRELVTGVG